MPHWKRILAWVLLLWAGVLLLDGLLLVGQLSRIKNDPEQVFKQPAETASLVRAVSFETRLAREALRPLFPLFRLLSRVPGLEVVGQVEPALHYATELTQAGAHLLDNYAPLLDVAASGQLSREALLAAPWPEVSTAAIAAMERAAQARKSLIPDTFPGPLQEYLWAADRHFDTLQKAVALAALAPDLFGMDGARTYLLVIQNHDELRASGGFVSALGEVTVARGDVTHLEVADSYAVDDLTKPYPPPPWPFQLFMRAGLWLPRDANWDPDFPSAAQDLVDLYTLSTGRKVDGVIAFDQELLKAVLRVTGPIAAPGFPTAVDADHVEQVLQQAWAPSPEEGASRDWWEHRKDFIPVLGRAILERVLQFQSREQLASLALETIHSIQSGHLLLYRTDAQVQSLLRRGGLDGGIVFASDGLALIDSNLGFNKVDAVVERRLQYTVDLRDPTQPRGEVRLTYVHPLEVNTPCRHEARYGQSGRYAELTERCYWDFWRLVIPDHTGLLDATQTPVPGDWLYSGRPWAGQALVEEGPPGTNVVEGLFVLPPGEQITLTLHTAVPYTVLAPLSGKAYRYNLTLRKQPGLKQLPVRVVVRPPAGYQVRWASPGWQRQGDDWVWERPITKTESPWLIFTPINPLASSPTNG